MTSPKTSGKPVNITLTLRPVRIGFVIEADNRELLHKIIQANSFLWGGAYNPIIPAFVPNNWKGSRRDRPSPEELIQGYLQTYDPDVIVRSNSEPLCSFGNREIIELSELVGPTETDGSPTCGIGLFEVLNHFIETELKFVRREPIEFQLTSFQDPSEAFLAAVFGSLSPTITDWVIKDYEVFLDQRVANVSTSDYLNLLRKPNLVFLRRLMSSYVQPRRTRRWGGDSCILVLDPDESSDIIQYWNLRALGWPVVPFSRQCIQQAEAREFALEIITDNYQPFLINPQRYNYTSIIRSSSVDRAEFSSFIESLDLSALPQSTEPAIKVLDYPQLWDAEVRDKHRIECYDLESETRTDEYVTLDDRISIKTLDPVFLDPQNFSGKARFANNLTLRLFGNNEIAEVIPEGGHLLTEAIGGLPFDSWRFSKRGITYLAKYPPETIRLSIPYAEGVMRQWLASQGWEAQLSDKGLIAKQMLKHLGGLWELWILSGIDIIKLLRRYGEGRTIDESALRKELGQIIGGKDPQARIQSLLSQLVAKQIFRLGVEVRCTVCRQRSWYSLQDLTYQVQCTKCLDEFYVPTHSTRDLKWSYRTFGPFSLPNQAYGVFSVLLTLRFFSLQLRGSTTPLLSFCVKHGNEEFEIDLGLLLREETMLRDRTSKTQLVLAECKTLNPFEEQDIDRLAQVARHFPEAILVLSTLRDELTDQEKSLIVPMVERSRKDQAENRLFNRILILTGIEIFGKGGPPICWRLAGGRYSELAGSGSDIARICDVTQQLHLGMDSFQALL